MKCSLKVLLLGALLLLFSQSSAFAAEVQPIDVGFNQITVKVEGAAVNSNNILYNGTTYISIRDVAAMLGIAVNYYDKTKTAYIGQIGAGEFAPDNQDIDHWDVVTPAAPSNEPIVPAMNGTIDAVLNEVTVKVHGQPLEPDNILYNGTTYVAMRAVAQSLGMPVSYDGATSTAYIGENGAPPAPVVPEPPEQPEASAETAPASGLYAVPADGDMAGWQVLMGHPYESESKIYFQNETMGTMNYLRVQVEDVRDIDLNQIIEWTDSNGNVLRNKLSDLYRIFAEYSGSLTSDYLHQTFGDIYFDWIRVRSIPAESLVNQYLTETGQVPEVKSNITLTPGLQIQTER